MGYDDPRVGYTIGVAGMAYDLLLMRGCGILEE